MNDRQLPDLAEEFGTPLYVYDAGCIRSQYRRLAAAFARLDYRLHYACKANANPFIIKVLKEAGAWLDCVSIGEVQLGLRCGFCPEQILYTPNSVGMAEVVQAVALGVRVTIDSLGLLEAFASEYGSRIPVSIRLNPHILAGGNPKIQTGHIDSKFGISLLQRAEILETVHRHGMRVYGLHVHTG